MLEASEVRPTQVVQVCLALLRRGSEVRPSSFISALACYVHALSPSIPHVVWGPRLTLSLPVQGFGSGAASTQPSAFSSTPASTGGGLFGGTASTTGNTPGFGGFGTSTTQNASPFGGGNTSGAGLFGAAKPAFGASNTAPLGGPSLFGGGNTTNAGGFGSTAPALPGAFGAGASTALGAGDVQCPGTGNTAFQAWTEKENGSSTTNHFQTISFMQPYMRFSLEV